MNLIHESVSMVSPQLTINSVYHGVGVTLFHGLIAFKMTGNKYWPGALLVGFVCAKHIFP